MKSSRDRDSIPLGTCNNYDTLHILICLCLNHWIKKINCRCFSLSSLSWSSVTCKFKYLKEQIDIKIKHLKESLFLTPLSKNTMDLLYFSHCFDDIVLQFCDKALGVMTFASYWLRLSCHAPPISATTGVACSPFICASLASHPADGSSYGRTSRRGDPGKLAIVSPDWR